MGMIQGFRCSCCGGWHDSLPMSYAFGPPASWHALPDEEREKRSQLSSDHCIIDNRYFFLRGLIEIPVVDSFDSFYWDVWVSVSAVNFRRSSALWAKAGREKEPPFFGWLNTLIPSYPSTGNLKTMVHTRPVGERPLIELEPTDHPLAIEQRIGITLKRVQEIAETLVHSSA
jgi:hypothetical protein